MGDGDRGSGLIYGVGSLFVAMRSAFRLFFFLPFLFGLPPCGELSGLEPLERSFLSATTCAGVAWAGGAFCWGTGG